MTAALVLLPNSGTQTAFDDILYAAEKPAENPAGKPPSDTNNKPPTEPNTKPTNGEEDDGGCKC